jgi:hypothetical protein
MARVPVARNASTHAPNSVDESNSHTLDSGFDECNEDDTLGLVPGLFLYAHPITLPSKKRRATFPPRSSLHVRLEVDACSADDLAESKTDEYHRFSGSESKGVEVEVDEPVGRIVCISIV